ncbi:MAG TPA: DsbA family protein [Stellaceae bacterium]|jgi:protein-disulfide isomerase|nr:DsbA family protein [Stellaceae bacterium]
MYFPVRRPVPGTSRLPRFLKPSGLFKIAVMLWCCALGLAAPAAAADFTPDQRKAIEGIIKDYLAKNPEVLLDALQTAEDKIKSDARDKASSALKEHQKEVFDDPSSPVGGNPKGDVALVEFFDYRCPYCKQVEPSLESLIGEDHQLRVVYKEFPVLGPASVTASRAALAAVKQGKYDVVHHALMNLKGQIDDALVLKTVAAAGIDMDRLKRDMEAPEIDQVLKANSDLADALDIHGTPGFVIGTEIIPGAIGIGDLKELIADARRK